MRDESDTSSRLTPTPRQRRATIVVEELMRRRARGETVPDREIIDAHPDLAPDLGERLHSLAAVERAEELAGRPTDDSNDEASSAGDAPWHAPPDLIRGYALIDEVHRGGQGIVYRARQKATGRDVAIKVMREGPFRGQQERVRFAREVHALALLRHPNIVTIHDSGTAAGCQYVVMDFIPGEALDTYVSAQPRDVADLLRLFVKISRAVHAAHLHGIIHRDLKPGNIRIDEAGEPHVLDFGLAKVSIEGIVRGPAPQPMTLPGQFLGSLPWSSPEQAEGPVDQIDLRTDIYSLGVVLFQMLTCEFPYPVTGGIREVLASVAEAQPVCPSTKRRNIDADVDAIVLKCLSKDPQGRYQSAAALVDDVERYLCGDTILARPPSTAYQIEKLIRRHKLPSALLAALLACLLGFSGWMSVLYSRAARAEQEAESRHVEAERQAATARAVNEFLTKRLLGASAPDVALGEDTTVSEVLLRASRAIDSSFHDQPLVKASVLSTLGGVFGARRDWAAAERYLREAEKIRLRELGEAHPDTIAAELALAGALRGMGRAVESESLGRETLELCRRTFGADHRLTLQAAESYATTLWHLERIPEAMDLHYDSLQRRRRVFGDDDPATVASLARWVNPYLLNEGRTAEAKRYAQEVVDRYRDLYGEDHPTTVGAVQSLAAILSSRGEIREAEPLFRAALEATQRLYGADNVSTLGAAVRYGLVLRDLRRIDEAEEVLRAVVESDALPEEHPTRLSALQYFGSVLYRQADYGGALRAFSELVDVRRSVLGDDSAETAASLVSLSNLMHALGRFPEAELGHREAYQVMRTVLGPAHRNTLWALRGLVRALAAQEKFEEARPLAEELLERRREVAERPDADASQRSYYVRELLTVQPEDLRDPELALQVGLRGRAADTDTFQPEDYWVAMAYRDTGDLTSATQTLQRLLESAPEEESLDRANYERLLVECYVQLGNLEEAEDVYRQTLARRRANAPDDEDDVAAALLNLGRFLLEQDRALDAAPLLRECLSIRRSLWGDDDWRVAECMSLLGEALVRQGERDEARTLLLGAGEAVDRNEYVPVTVRRSVAERLSGIPGASSAHEPFEAGSQGRGLRE